MRLGKGVNLGTPAISTIGPARDMFALLKNGLVEMSKRRSFCKCPGLHLCEDVCWRGYVLVLVLLR